MNGDLPIVAVGSVVVDLIRQEASEWGHTINIGGVCLHAAAAASVAGLSQARIDLVTVTYDGGFSDLIAGYLSRLGINWERLPSRAGVPVFSAVVGAEGELLSYSFVGETAYSALRWGELKPFAQGGNIVTCDDLPVEVIDALIADAAHAGRRSLLISTSTETVARIGLLRRLPTYVCLNSVELESIVGRGKLDSLQDVARAARVLAAPDGATVVTLGAEGALLAPATGPRFLHQRVPASRGVAGRWTGAGDVAFGRFAFEAFRSEPSSLALRRAMIAAHAFGLSQTDGNRRYFDMTGVDQTSFPEAREVAYA